MIRLLHVDDAAKLLNNGTLEVICKPFDPIPLPDKIKQVMQKAATAN